MYSKPENVIVSMEKLLHTIASNIMGAYMNSRVGTKYIKFSDQAPNWAKVVPWYGV